MRMHNPPHPGEIIRRDCLKPLALSVTAAAAWLGVSRQSLSELLNGRNGVSAEMAIRLEKAGWSTAETWLGAQTAHDLWHARRHARSIRVKRYPVAKAARAAIRDGRADIARGDYTRVTTPSDEVVLVADLAGRRNGS